MRVLFDLFIEGERTERKTMTKNGIFKNKIDGFTHFMVTLLVAQIIRLVARL
jgi:hypothetical protein